MFNVKTHAAQKRDGAYAINLDKEKSTGTHWITLYMNGDNMTYLDSFGVKYIPEEILKNHQKHHKYLEYRIQSYNSIICGFFYIDFIDFMIEGKNFLDYANFFSPSEYGKNDKIILKYFQ